MGDKTLLPMTPTTVNPSNNNNNLNNNPNLNSSTTTTTRTTTMFNPHRPLPTGTPSSTPTIQHIETSDTTRMQPVTEGLLRGPVLPVFPTAPIVLELTHSSTLMILAIGLDMLLLSNLLLDLSNSNNSSQTSTTTTIIM